MILKLKLHVAFVEKILGKENFLLCFNELPAIAYIPPGRTNSQAR